MKRVVTLETVIARIRESKGMGRGAERVRG